MDGGAASWREPCFTKALLRSYGCTRLFTSRIKPGVFQPLLIWIACLMQPERIYDTSKLYPSPVLSGCRVVEENVRKQTEVVPYKY